MRWDDVTAVFGGTFDPPHLGHVEAVRGLFRVPGVKRVLVVPSGKPSQKEKPSAARERLEMTRLAFPPRAFPGRVEILTTEMDHATQTGKPSYSYDTIRELGRETPKLAFVIGTDQLRGLPTWHRFPEILALCHWIVLARKPEGMSGALEAIHSLETSGLIRPAGDLFWQVSAAPERYLKPVLTEARAASGTEIREEIARTGAVPPDKLPRTVMAYLKQNQLYGTQREAHDGKQ